jgi:hypothetical protein
MNPVFGTPVGTGVWAKRRNRDTYADAEYVWKCLVPLGLVDQKEPAGIGETCNAVHGGNAAECREDHGMTERKFVDLADAAVFGDLFDGHFSGVGRLHACAGDPLDVALAQFALEEPLGVADAVKSEMSDIGLGRHECHRHPVANAAFMQLGIQDEDELVGRTEARRPGRGADHDRTRRLHKLVRGFLRLGGMIDVTN